MYEALVSLSWCTVLIILVMEQKFKTEIMGVFVFPLVSIAMAYASLSPNVRDEIEPLIPALQSNWLTYHVLTCFLGYAAFAVSFGASIAYLIKDREADVSSENSLLPEITVLDEVIYKGVGVGFLLLGIGIITGAVWANYAWGSYWSWDPKETWSLITWLIYATFLHARLNQRVEREKNGDPVYHRFLWSHVYLLRGQLPPFRVTQLRIIKYAGIPPV